MFIGHVCYGVGVGAVEVDEPGLWDYFCGLGLDGLEVALAEPTVDGVISVACGGDDLRYSEGIGNGFEFFLKPRAEADGQRRRKSCFVRLGFSCIPILCGGEFGVGCNVFFGVFCVVLYVGEQVFFQYGIFSCSLAGVLAIDKSVVEHPSALSFTDVKGTPHLFS